MVLTGETEREAARGREGLGNLTRVFVDPDADVAPGEMDFSRHRSSVARSGRASRRMVRRDAGEPPQRVPLTIKSSSLARPEQNSIRGADGPVKQPRLRDTSTDLDGCLPSCPSLDQRRRRKPQNACPPPALGGSDVATAGELARPGNCAGDTTLGAAAS